MPDFYKRGYSFQLMKKSHIESCNSLFGLFDRKSKSGNNKGDAMGIMSGLGKIISLFPNRHGLPAMRDFLCGTNDEISIKIPALPRPTLVDFRGDYPYISTIVRDFSPRGPVTFRLATVLNKGELSVGGPEYQRRLVMSDLRRVLGFQQLAWMIAHQDDYPVFLSFLGEFSIDGSALTVIDENGVENTPYICKNNGTGRWVLKFAPIWSPTSNFDRRCRVATAG
jgi:hypothetical protein